MTASEFAFLALGLVLGTAAGAALVEVIRARPPAPREVRVTMTPQTVPTRSATLAADPFDRIPAGPAPFGPGDRRTAERPRSPVVAVDPRVGPPVFRTSFVPVPVGAAATASLSLGRTDLRTPVLPSLPVATRSTAAGATGGSAAAGRSAGLSAVAVAVADPPTVAIVAASSRETRSGQVSPTAATRGETTAGETSSGASVPGSGKTGSEAARPNGDGPCAELRSVAGDRCAVAARARESADAALAALRDAQRASDEASRQADEAAATADPRTVRAAKEAAQLAFRSAREGAATREELEVAARSWLAAINRINLEAREATGRAARARTTSNELVTTIERLTAEADAARVAREVAEEACVAARQAVADCEEAESLAAAAAIAAAPLPAVEPAAHFPDDEPELAFAAPGGGEARIFRLLRGDREALLRTVAELAGDDANDRRRWQIALTGLVDAVVAQAIDGSIIDIPDEPPFWEPFTSAQRREIVAALASLGYRFDGLGGFADGRVPSQRDLSLAVGYAGLDPMRIRRWPNEAEARELLSGAAVAAPEYLATAAGGLTLSELVDLLGRRADGLTDLWNDWGRVRGRLLAAD